MISDKKYDHVLNVWNKFEMKMMKNYHQLYLKCDVLFLVDVLKDLEIIAYIKKVELELIPYPHMHFLISYERRRFLHF